MVILYINRSDSRCGACNRSCMPMDEVHETPAGWDQHPGCGARFTHLSSTYSDFEDLYDTIKAMRPDLKFIDFWNIPHDERRV